MLTAIATNVITGWLWRRVQELGSLATFLIPLYLAMPPNRQAEIQMILSGQGGGLSISAGLGLAWYLWTQFQSFRATTVAQVVTADGQKIMPKADSVAMERVETQAKAAPKRQTLWERLFGQS